MIERGSIREYRIYPRTPTISHLSFTDSIIIFYGANLEEAVEVKRLNLKSYEKARERMVNFSKTDVSLSKGVSEERRSDIALCLDIQEVRSHDKYLGVSTFVGRSRKRLCCLLLTAIRNSCQGL